MKQTQRNAAQAPTPAKRSSTKAAETAAPAKSWSVKVEVRLPHKIGQPLGSSSSDGGSN